jgi:hypothetical protein
MYFFVGILIGFILFCQYKIYCSFRNISNLSKIDEDFKALEDEIMKEHNEH